MCIELDLFSGVQLAPSCAAEETISEVEKVFVFNPCTGCKYKDMCDDGECAMMLFPLDASIFPNMEKAEEDYLSMLKRQGW